MNTKTFQKVAGCSSISLGLIYILAFIIYGAILQYPGTGGSDADTIAYLSDNYLLLSSISFLSYVLFGILLAVLVVALYMMTKISLPNFSILASAFGIVWVGLVIASGMITTIGLDTVIKIGIENPEKAMTIWSSVGIVSEALGGGNEIVGGLWVLLLSILNLKGSFYSKSLSFLGLLVGFAGILTVLPIDIFKEIFGISQIIWFIWVGIALIRRS